MKAWLDPDTSEFKDRKQCGFFLPEMLAVLRLFFSDCRKIAENALKRIKKAYVFLHKPLNSLELVRGFELLTG